jgi:hypothetical protein
LKNAPASPAPGPVSDALADQALANLVSQFARPLDCLRELVQNSIDAGSPRVEVWVRARGGVLEIHVDDFGEGMDEAAIDRRLTSLFASDKEHDLARIGKFGIGFTSIFAIEPDAVLLRTGRHGESWELLFHPDRSFDKVRLEAPNTGTQITLFKRLSPAATPRFVQECRWILTYWCEHSDTPITFEERRDGAEASAGGAGEDPFGAFSAPVAARETVNRPLALEGDLVRREEAHGVTALVGLGAPSYGFYNGGLTLISGSDPAVLEGPDQDFTDMARYRFKVKSDVLEHTLTRDNVIRDERWVAAMRLVRQAADGLVEALLERTERAVAAGEPLGVWHAHLAAEERRFQARDRRRILRRPLFRDHRGAPLTMEAIDRCERARGLVLVADGGSALADALEAEGAVLVEDLPQTRALLAAWAPGGWWAARGRRVVRRVEEIYTAVAPAEEPPSERERALLARCGALLRAAGAARSLSAGEISGGDRGWRDALALEAPPEGGLARRQPQGARWRRLRTRSLWLNRAHPVYLSWLAAAEQAPGRAAFGLAQAALYDEGGVPERTWRRLLSAALEQGA